MLLHDLKLFVGQERREGATEPEYVKPSKRMKVCNTCETSVNECTAQDCFLKKKNPYHCPPLTRTIYYIKIIINNERLIVSDDVSVL